MRQFFRKKKGSNTALWLEPGLQVQPETNVPRTQLQFPWAEGLKLAATWLKSRWLRCEGNCGHGHGWQDSCSAAELDAVAGGEKLTACRLNLTTS